MYTYQLTKPALGQTESNIVKRSDNVWIPFDLANTDYRDYLAWLAEGNTPEPVEVNNG